jgi:hypothetical protein
MTIAMPGVGLRFGHLEGIADISKGEGLISALRGSSPSGNRETTKVWRIDFLKKYERYAELIGLNQDVSSDFCSFFRPV